MRVAWMPGPPAGVDPRHPLDPEPARASKAAAVLALGIVAVVTGPFVGGVVPATLALLLGRQARREAYAAGGFLLGGGRVRRGESLAWIGLGLAATSVVVALVIGLMGFAEPPGSHDFYEIID